jgi:hypothetical protein
MPLDASGQTIQFSCANLPAGISCAFAPASLTLNDSPVTTQLTISEGATIVALGGKSSSGLGGILDTGDGLEVRTGMQTVFIPALCCEMFLLAGLWRRSNSGRTCGPVRVAYAAVLLLTVATFLGGCSNLPPQPTTTTVTINAAVGTQVVPLSLNVTIQN